MSDLTAAVLFLMIVGLIVVVGIVVGIIVAGRMDRLMTPPPSSPTAAPEPAGDGGAADRPSAEEEQP